MIGIVVGLAAEARIARRLGIVEIGGGGEGGATEAAARLVARGATALVSFGLCGGLDPKLVAGDLVVPDSVMSGEAKWDTDAALRARLGPGASGALYGGGELLTRAAQKRNLHRTVGAVAVDLESAAVARAGLPFAVLRAVCDPAGRSLPHVAEIAIDGRGRIGALRVFIAVLKRPHQLASLLGLARDAGRARRALMQRVRAIAPLEPPA